MFQKLSAYYVRKVFPHTNVYYSTQTVFHIIWKFLLRHFSLVYYFQWILFGVVKSNRNLGKTKHFKVGVNLKRNFCMSWKSYLQDFFKLKPTSFVRSFFSYSGINIIWLIFIILNQYLQQNGKYNFVFPMQTNGIYL